MGFFSSLIRALREIHESNQEIGKAIRENTETCQRQFELITSQRATPPAFPEVITAYYQAEQNVRKSNRRWKALERAAAVSAFVLAIGAALFTYRSLSAITRETSLIEADQRPWMKIVSAEFAEEAPQGSLYFPAEMPTLNGRKWVAINVRMRVKNVGREFARDVVIWPMIGFRRRSARRDPISDIANRCAEPVTGALSGAFTISGLFPGDEREMEFGVPWTFAVEDINSFSDKQGEYLSPVFMACIGYQHPRPFLTRAVFTVSGDSGGFVEIGRPLIAPSVRLLREESYEYAQ